MMLVYDLRALIFCWLKEKEEQEEEIDKIRGQIIYGALMIKKATRQQKVKGKEAAIIEGN